MLAFAIKIIAIKSDPMVYQFIVKEVYVKFKYRVAIKTNGLGCFQKVSQTQ